MPNINAALGLAQIEKLEKLLNLKRKLSTRYKKCFTKFKNELKFLKKERTVEVIIGLIQ